MQNQDLQNFMKYMFKEVVPLLVSSLGKSEGGGDVLGSKMLDKAINVVVAHFHVLKK